MYTREITNEFYVIFFSKIMAKMWGKKNRTLRMERFFFFFLEKIVRGDAEQGKKNPLIHNSLTT